MDGSMIGLSDGCSSVHGVSELGATVLLPRPARGRTFSAARRVRLADVAPAGRLRLDAIARYLQDIARDDSADAGYRDAMGWVVRRTMIEVAWAPRFEEWLDLTTWCSGFGGRWAERRTEMRGDKGGLVEAVTVWVHVDEQTGAPRRLGEDFFEIWGEGAAGRRVSARTSLRNRPAPGCKTTLWPVRATDLDLLGHMNNAAHWAPVEEALTMHGGVGKAIKAELEHGPGIELDHDVVLHVAEAVDGVETWLMVEDAVITAARVGSLRRQ